ncbi:hypothetical protein LVY65_02815 [Sphingomonas sp. G124]|uniref:Uncharacterized protein n=1 Tax=Sphingomonas cremea TaxID=2904799 RepID=A0A9X1QKU4_9SPHN|nr:hypothetical protein [Sphingomonas cremea]MCF2514002.1 hypothetical protein [Sphingomonas cremea]
MKWSEVADLELEQSSGKSAVLIRAGSVSGAASLDDLHVHPMGVWDVVKRCRERALA